ncbi:MAG: protein kinase [Myxococcales bacterium]|nr:protein kinase [Myxococcales bacterium]
MNTDSLPLRFGDYTLLRKIASGGMAEIFLAQAHAASGADKLVALKMIHSRYAEERHFHRMMVEEARIAVQLAHPNIGQVFDLGQYGGRYFLVMEYIDGPDLSRTLEACRDRHMTFPIEVAAFVGHEVAAALSYAHKLDDRRGRPLNLIHRDISPQNVLLSFGGEVKIIDFGIAKVATQMQQTQVGVIKGKFYYMSPEQAGAQDVDQRSDLFSLGICLWETLVGRSLFRRDDGPTNPLAILHEVRTMPIPRVREVRPDCPSELDGIVAKALSRDLSVRYPNAEAMREALARFLVPVARTQPAVLLADFMERAFPQSGDAQGPSTEPVARDARMDREEFEPSEASVIFSLDGPGPAGGSGIDLDWIDPSTATRVFDRDGDGGANQRIPRAADRADSKAPRPSGASIRQMAPPPPLPSPTAPLTPFAPPAARTGSGASVRPSRAGAPFVSGPAVDDRLPSTIASIAGRPPAPTTPEAVPASVPPPPVPVAPPHRPTSPSTPAAASEPPSSDDGDLAISSTVYVRRDALAAPPMWLKADASPAATSVSLNSDEDSDDPNVRTMAVDANAIRAAHEAFAARQNAAAIRATGVIPAAAIRERVRGGTEMVTPIDLALSSHPLFRWLVILLLVFVVLAATLTLLVVRRTTTSGGTGASEAPGIERPPAPP